MKAVLTTVAWVVFCFTSASTQAQSFLEFDGDDMVTIPDSASLNPTQITVECRVNFARLADGATTSTSDRAQQLLGKGNDRTPGAYYLRQFGDTLALGVGEVSGDWSVAGTVPLETNRWYHVAGTYDGGTLGLYLDGEPIGAQVVGVADIGTASPLLLGHHSLNNGGIDWDYFLTGLMDEVAIWDYARGIDGIRETMNGDVLTGAEPGLMGYWGFDEPLSSQAVLDATANGNDGYLGAIASPDNADPARVPEPSTATLLCMGVFGLLACTRRKKR